MVYITLISALALAIVSVYGAILPRVSSTPCTPYTCPSTDDLGYQLGVTTSGATLFCSYPGFPGQDPNSFYCTYNPSTGILIEDRDVGLCPDSAVFNSCSTRRDEISKNSVVRAYKELKEKRKPFAGEMAPEFIAARSRLAQMKGKRAERSS